VGHSDYSDEEWFPACSAMLRLTRLNRAAKAQKGGPRARPPDPLVLRHAAVDIELHACDIGAVVGRDEHRGLG
jgi:hypothetical protein